MTVFFSFCFIEAIWETDVNTEKKSVFEELFTFYLNSLSTVERVISQNRPNYLKSLSFIRKGQMHQTANLHNTFLSFRKEKFSILTIFDAFLSTLLRTISPCLFSPKITVKFQLPSFLVLSKLGKIAREAEQDSHFQGKISHQI